MAARGAGAYGAPLHPVRPLRALHPSAPFSNPLHSSPTLFSPLRPSVPSAPSPPLYTPRRPRQVVAPHGAGLANLIFAPPVRLSQIKTATLTTPTQT